MSADDSTPRSKPAKPYPEYPLLAHAAGCGPKKIRGKSTRTETAGAAALLVRDAQQLGVFCLRQAELPSGNNGMRQSAQEAHCAGVDILVSEKLHGVAAK